MKKLIASLVLGLSLGLGVFGAASVASAQTAPAAATAPARPAWGFLEAVETFGTNVGVGCFQRIGWPCRRLIGLNPVGLDRGLGPRQSGSGAPLPTCTGSAVVAVVAVGPGGRAGIGGSGALRGARRPHE